MKIYTSPIEELPYNGAVVTVGTFDGVHKGHQKIIEKVLEQSRLLGVNSVLVTFEPHPKLVVQEQGRSQIYLLTTIKEKITVLDAAGLDCLVVSEFTKTFAKTPAEEFVRDTLVGKLKMKSIIIGHDHAFGRDRQGNLQLLQRLGAELDFQVHTVMPIKSNSGIISSTRIRHLLADGNIEMANTYLGRPYSVCGKVVKGKERGRQLGYPTANVLPDEPSKLVPKVGIYATTVSVGDQIYTSVTYIGKRPTFRGEGKVIEVHVHDFDKEIYEQEITVYFHTFLLEDRRFNSKTELVKAIKKDKNNAIKYFDNGGIS